MSVRRLLAAGVWAGVAAALLVACGGSPPVGPTPGGGGGGGGGVVTPPNAPPVVRSITLADSRVEVGVPVTVTAVVEDAETPVASLTYTWTADTGTFSGSGSTVTWTPGADAKTPADYVLTLTVTERYTNGSVQAENKATGTVTAHVNNSSKELADLSVRFLNDFANSRVSPDLCVAEFSDSLCARGKADEFNDIFMNRHDLKILASTIRPTSVIMAPSRVTATVHTFCSFTSEVITSQPLNCPGCKLGDVGTTSGDCHTTNVYEKGRWWLCESHYTSSGSLTALQSALTRALFGVQKPRSP